MLTVRVARPAALAGLDAATGTVRWALRLPGAGLVGRQVATGQPRWTRNGLPGQTQVQALAGKALVTSNGAGPWTSPALVAADPATGRIAWRFDPARRSLLAQPADLMTGCAAAG